MAVNELTSSSVPAETTFECGVVLCRHSGHWSCYTAEIGGVMHRGLPMEPLHSLALLHMWNVTPSAAPGTIEPASRKRALWSFGNI